MGQKAWWGATAGLAVSLFAAGAFGADEDDVYRSSRPSSTIKKRTDTKKADDTKKSSAGKKKPEPDATLADAPKPPDLSQQLQEERLKFLRRQQVCDRLREIAQETGDKSLEQNADLLESRAWFIYQQRSGQLQLPGLGPMSTTAAVESLTRTATSSAKQGGQSAVRSTRAEKTTPTGDRKE